MDFKLETVFFGGTGFLLIQSHKSWKCMRRAFFINTHGEGCVSMVIAYIIYSMCAYKPHDCVPYSGTLQGQVRPTTYLSQTVTLACHCSEALYFIFENIVAHVVSPNKTLIRPNVSKTSEPNHVLIQ